MAYFVQPNPNPEPNFNLTSIHTPALNLNFQPKIEW